MNIMYLLAERGVDIFANGCNYQVLRCVRSLSFTKSLKFSTFERITPGSRTLHSVTKVQSSNFSSKWTKRMCQQELFSLYTRNLCSTAPPVESQESQTFKNILTFRQQQAQHSIIVELASGEDLRDACSFCEQFGNVRKLIHYHSGSKKDFLIVEYSNAEVLRALLKSCKHNVVEGMIPVYSRLLHFEKNKKYSKGKSEVACESVHLHDETNINQQHHGTATVSEKIEEMYQRERLTDFGTRLRFLVCTQLEDALSGMFPQCKIYPFGSSVNGFGRNNCDLDVILRHYPHQSNPGSPLFFKTKKPLSSLRVQDKRSLETLSDILRNFLPGISHVNEILNARVPIVKFHHDLLEMECDLSVSQMSGVHMSELLYLCGELDPRVRPLVFAAKKWAQTSHLTNSSPGYWITNFSISLLMIFFLQTRPFPILPPFNKAINPSVLQFCDSLDDIGIKNCCEMKSASHNSNTETLDFLLKEFFHFIEAFPYKERSISVFDGHAPFKLDHSPLHIQNPLEHQLNVSKNVNEDEVNRLREAARSTLWVIETNNNNSDIKPWNFLNIFDSATKEIRKLEKVIFSDLFNKENNADYQVVATANSDKEIKISFPIRKHIQDKSNVSNTSKNQVVPNINSKRKSKQNRRHLLSAKDIWRRW